MELDREDGRVARGTKGCSVHRVAVGESERERIDRVEGRLDTERGVGRNWASDDDDDDDNETVDRFHESRRR